MNASNEQKSPSKGNFTHTPSNQISANSSAAVASEEFIIGPEDGLTINVWKEPELSSTVVVRPDGKITLPLINEIQASGLTARHLQERIAERLKDFISSPVVTVIVKEIHSQNVIIMGEVAKPGAYPFGSPMTVVEAIGRAGGFLTYAKTKKIEIIRRENDRQSRYPFNYNDFIKGKNTDQNIFLKNGDVIIVP